MSTSSKTTSYNNVLENTFSNLEPKNFRVDYKSPPIVFVCGGPMLENSLRALIFESLDEEGSELEGNMVIAENIKDYFKEGAYKDLMDFEDDIANISSLIIICLESAGSLVELGLFCNRKEIKNRLLVFVPDEEVQGNIEKEIPEYSSFIYLGPLQSLKDECADSVRIYPFPQKDKFGGGYEEIDFIKEDILNKYAKTKKLDTFDENNSGHLAFLIYEIIRVAQPIKLTEIELALICMEIDIEQKVVTRLIYLISNFKLISCYEYSNTKYYYVFNRELNKVKLKSSFDFKNSTRELFHSFNPAFNKQIDEANKKRFAVFKHIIKKVEVTK